MRYDYGEMEGTHSYTVWGDTEMRYDYGEMEGTHIQFGETQK